MMPEFTALHLAMLAGAFVAGVGIGWLLRSDRCAREKIAINAGWQEQLEGQQAEHDRLANRVGELERQLAACRASEEAAEGALAEARSALEERERKIARLARQLGSWRARVPPLVERYREREREVEELRSGLDRAADRIARLEAMTREAEREAPPADANGSG